MSSAPQDDRFHNDSVIAVLDGLENLVSMGGHHEPTFLSIVNSLVVVVRTQQQDMEKLRLEQKQELNILRNEMKTCTDVTRKLLQHIATQDSLSSNSFGSLSQDEVLAAGYAKYGIIASGSIDKEDDYVKFQSQMNPSLSEETLTYDDKDTNVREPVYQILGNIQVGEGDRANKKRNMPEIEGLEAGSAEDIKLEMILDELDIRNESLKHVDSQPTLRCGGNSLKDRECISNEAVDTSKEVEHWEMRVERRFKIFRLFGAEDLGSLDPQLWAWAKKGYCGKKGGGHLSKAWKKRWIVLQSVQLPDEALDVINSFHFIKTPITDIFGMPFYYRNDKEKELLGIIDLAECTSIGVADHSSKRGIENILQIIVQERTYYLSCHSQIEMMDWIRVLSYVRRLTIQHRLDYMLETKARGRPKPSTVCRKDIDDLQSTLSNRDSITYGIRKKSTDWGFSSDSEGEGF